MLLYAFILLIVARVLWSQRSYPLGASIAFLYILLIFHGPALFFFTEVWAGEFELGQLPYLIKDIASYDIVPRVYMAMSICIISVLLGAHLYGFFHPVLRQLLGKMHGISTVNYNIERALLIAQVSMLMISLFLLVQFLFIAPPTELFRYYFSGIDEFEKVEIRRTATLPFYPYQVLLTAVFPFLSFVLIAQSQQDIARGIKRPRIKKYAVIFTLLVMLAKLSQYNKAGPVIFFLQILFALTYARTLSFRIHVWHLRMFLLGLFGIIGITALVNSADNWILTFFSSFERTFMIPNEVIFEYFASIPQHLAHGYGTGISWISIFTSNGSEELMGTYWKVGAIVRGGYGSTSNSFFIGDAWAEFSWYGIVVFSLMGGWLIRWHDHQVARWGTSPVAIALLVSAYYGAYTLGTTAMTTAMLTGGLLLTPIFANVLRTKRKAFTNTL